MTRPKRMTFALKLLDCGSEFSLTLNDMKRVLVSIMETTAPGEYDPNIYYATSPRVLGYWLYSELGMELEDLRDTPYMPVDTFF